MVTSSGRGEREKGRQGSAYKIQLSSVPLADQSESFPCALASEESMKTMAKSHAWLGWSIPCCTSRPQAVQNFPAPFPTFSSEGFPDLQLQGRRLKTWLPDQSGHFDDHSQNKDSSPSGKLKSMLKIVGLIRAHILASYQILFVFQHRHHSVFFPDPDH